MKIKDGWKSWAARAGIALVISALLICVGLHLGRSDSERQSVQKPCVCKAESCPAAPACPDPPKPVECPAPPPSVCPDVECTEQVVTFGDYFSGLAAQAENQLRPLKYEFEAKKAELDPIFARAKELNIGPRQAWVGNPEAVQVYLTTISRIGELEAIWNRMQQIVQSSQERMDRSWYESLERRNLWSTIPDTVEPYRDQLQAFTAQADDRWFTHLCAWDYEKRTRDGGR